MAGRCVWRTYNVSEIANRRATGEFEDNYPVEWEGNVFAFSCGFHLGKCAIAFPHGPKTHRFGIQVSEQDAKAIIERLPQFLPSIPEDAKEAPFDQAVPS